MFGDGSTHGSPSPRNGVRLHPAIVTTSRSAPMAKCSLKSRASSPIVMPWRIGTGNNPTNDSNPRSSIGPSTATPPMGFGRSQTVTFTPCLRAARRQFAIV
jgi:hypothetical protein